MGKKNVKKEKHQEKGNSEGESINIRE